MTTYTTTTTSEFVDKSIAAAQDIILMLRSITDQKSAALDECMSIDDMLAVMETYDNAWAACDNAVTALLNLSKTLTSPESES